MPENRDATAAVESLMFQNAFEGISQYRNPLCFELTGKMTSIQFDDGSSLDIQWISGSRARFTDEKGNVRTDNYQCTKADDQVYLVLVDRNDLHPREGLILVMDFAVNLVTANFAKQGTYPDFPELVRANMRFGYIRRDGRKPPEKRHAFTNDLVGRKYEWNYTPEFRICHIYMAPDHYRWGQTDENRRARDIPVNDRSQSAYYIKLRDNLYIFSWIEDNGGGGTEGFIVLNTDRVTDTGCFFGCAGPDKHQEAYLFCAYGKPVTEHLQDEDPEDRYQKP